MKLRPEEEWIYTLNTHPAIISMDTYEKVKKMRMERTEKGKVHKNPGMYSARELNFFKGKCFCADCGGPMYLGRHDKQVRYYCGNHSLKKICFAHYVSDTKVNDEVLRVIHLIESYRDKRLLTKKMVDAFVKKVTLDRDGNAIVELIYDDFLKDLVSYAKEREAQDEE